MREKVAILLWICLGVLVLRFGWIWLSRHEENARLERAIEAKRKPDGLPKELQGDQVKILNFYARSGEVPAGGRELLCYGVLNAKQVRMTPEVEDKMYPAISRCFWVAPQRTTKYTLTAVGADGTETSASLELRVTGAHKQ